LEYDSQRRILNPNQDGIFFLSLNDPLAQPLVAVLARDVPDKKLRVTVNASHCRWAACLDEVPAAIRQFARAVLHQQQLPQ
jgi:hypothetical protein